MQMFLVKYVAVRVVVLDVDLEEEIYVLGEGWYVVQESAEVVDVIC